MYITSAKPGNVARQEIFYGRQRSLEQTLEGVDRVTPARVRNLARTVLADQSLTMAAVGQVERLRVREQDLQL